MKYIYNYSKLLGRMREKNITQAELAKKLGISETSLNLSLNNKRPFRQSEISNICSCIDIPQECIDAYFFAR